MTSRVDQGAGTVVTSDGVTLHVRVTGVGAPLLFVHEFTGNHRSWDPQVAYFGRHGRCIVFNARGYPPSAIPPSIDAYGQARAADDAADVLRALATEPAHVVGLSMGAFAALHLGLRHPHLVRSLTIAGCGYGAKPEQQPEHGERMCAEANHAQAIGIEAFAQEMANSSYAAGLRAKDVHGWETFAAQLAGLSIDGMAMTLRGVLATRPSLWHLETELRALHVPVLLVTGDDDDACLEPNLYLKRMIPGAALCVLPRTGHLANLETPALFNDTVFYFITAVDRGRWRGWTGRSDNY